MNKGITLLVLVAILGAMGLVLYSHSNVSTETPPPAADNTAARQTPYGGNGQASPLGGLQGPDRGLSPMEPPITSGRPPANTPEGAPVPVTLGPDGQAKRPTAPESPAAKSDTPEKPAAPAPQKAPESPEDKTPAPTGETAKTDAAAKGEEGKSPSSAPGLEPWSVPPPAQNGAASGTAEGSARNGAGTAQSPAATPAATATPQSPAAGQRLATDPVRPAGTQSGAHTMTGISLSPSGQGMRLRIEADNEFASKSFVLTGPDRLVIDLPGSWSAVKSPSVPQNSLVKSVRVGRQAAGTRLVLDLTGPIKQHRVERSGTAVDVLLY